MFSSPLLAGAFFTAEDGGVMQRWRFLEDGSLQRDGRISFAGLGLTDLFLRTSNVQFVSPDKAYLFDVTFTQIVVFNPSTLEIIETLDIPGVEPAGVGEFLDFCCTTIRRNDELFFTSTYKPDPVDDVFSRADLIVIDTTTDEVSVDRTTACGDLRSAVLRSNGDIVWASGTFPAELNAVDPDRGFEPCMVTVRSGSVRFEEGSVSLTDLTGGPAGNLVPAGEDRALTLVYDEESFPIPDDAMNITLQVAWQWWEVDLNDMAANLIPDQEYVLGATLDYNIDGVGYLVTFSADDDGFATSTVNLVPPEGLPVPGISVPGVLQNGIVLLRDP